MVANNKIHSLAKFIRNIPDYPKKGIVFRDITTLLNDSNGFSQALDVFEHRYQSQKIDKVAGIESRGFIFGAALADRLHTGFVPIRKKGKLPASTIREEYELEYGTDAIEIHRDALQKGDRVLLIDDLLATGGTMLAATRLIEQLHGNIVGIAFLVELSFLRGREKLARHDVFSIIDYPSEEV
ncbi:MAG: adenine phosphoribosyltransferase [Ignavibacteriales bacterium]|nr:adenine phosphoribosyltransferase [Ignavibacteriales bacterium]